MRAECWNLTGCFEFLEDRCVPCMEDFQRSYFGICGKIMKQKKPNRQDLCKICYDRDVYQVLYLSQWGWVLMNMETKFDNVIILSSDNILSVYSKKTHFDSSGIPDSSHE